MCVSGQSKGWLGYSALLEAVIGCPLPTESMTFATVDDLVNTVFRDSKTSVSVLQSTPTSLWYDCVVCDKSIYSVPNCINDIAGPKNDWQRPVSQSTSANNHKYVIEYRRQKRLVNKEKRTRPYPVMDTDDNGDVETYSTSRDDETSDDEEDDNQRKPTIRRTRK